MFTQRPKCLFSVFFQRTASDACAVHSVVKCRVLDGRSRSSFVRLIPINVQEATRD